MQAADGRGRGCAGRLFSRMAAKGCVGHEPGDAPEGTVPSLLPARSWAWRDAGHSSRHRGSSLRCSATARRCTKDSSAATVLRLNWHEPKSELCWTTAL